MHHFLFGNLLCLLDLFELRRETSDLFREFVVFGLGPGQSRLEGGEIVVDDLECRLCTAAAASTEGFDRGWEYGDFVGNALFAQVRVRIGEFKVEEAGDRSDEEFLGNGRLSGRNTSFWSDYGVSFGSFGLNGEFQVVRGDFEGVLDDAAGCGNVNGESKGSSGRNGNRGSYVDGFCFLVGFEGRSVDLEEELFEFAVEDGRGGPKVCIGTGFCLFDGLVGLVGVVLAGAGHGKCTSWTQCGRVNKSRQ